MSRLEINHDKVNISVVPDAETVLSDERECCTEVPGDPDCSRGGPEDYFVPPGDGGASCCLCSGRAHGEELCSDPGTRAGPVQPLVSPELFRHRPGFNGTKDESQNPVN